MFNNSIQDLSEKVLDESVDNLIFCFYHGALYVVTVENEVCGHFFCDRCFIQTLKCNQQKKCPRCQADIKNILLRRQSNFDNKVREYTMMDEPSFNCLGELISELELVRDTVLRQEDVKRNISRMKRDRELKNHAVV